MRERTHHDISNFSFQEFVEFLFDHPLRKNKDDSEWYWKVEVTFDPEKICSYYVKLFRSPEVLLARFSEAQLEQAFWAMCAGSLECSAYSIVLGQPELSFEARVECIRSMHDLFSHLFTLTSLDTSVHMWWDCFCYDWHCGNRKRERGGEDLALQNELFDTLSRILYIDSETCHAAALHGLGHLHHPDTAQLIGRFIDEHGHLSSELKDYARAAARFEVL